MTTNTGTAEIGTPTGLRSDDREILVGDRVNAGTMRHQCWCVVRGTLDGFKRTVLIEIVDEPAKFLTYERGELTWVGADIRNGQPVNVWAVA